MLINVWGSLVNQKSQEVSLGKQNGTLGCFWDLFSYRGSCEKAMSFLRVFSIKFS